jgi:aspartyl-tRNA(Asn)/glutamyl-tRNA(Gln) amidotransferase subunit B
MRDQSTAVQCDTEFETVIGLEVHIQVNTKSKAFCGDANSFGDAPNTHISPVSLAHPGTLPVANTSHVQKAIELGLSLGCDINQVNYFDRKHYFYPDLPKGYQLTQDGAPICMGGTLEYRDGDEIKTAEIHHIHLEEDAGKNIHDLDPMFSLVDLNRAGTPLLEMVTEPVFRSGQEVYSFIAALQRRLRYYDISDADMEKGSLRCDCNVSVRPVGSAVLGERCEIKNLNSKRFARDAVEYESKRQVELILAGQAINKQTLHFDVENGVTKPLRDKEEAHDYRYFPDPDLTPLMISDNQIEDIAASLPPRPEEITTKLIKEYGLNSSHSEIILQHPSLYAIFERLNSSVNDGLLVANFMINQLLPGIPANVRNFDTLNLPIEQFGAYLRLIKEEKVSASVANQRLWPEVLANPSEDPSQMAENMGIVLKKDDDFIDRLVNEVIEANPDQVKRFKQGKKALIGFFMGEVMKKSSGSADPKMVKKRLFAMLDQS